MTKEGLDSNSLAGWLSFLNSKGQGILDMH